LQVGGVDVLNTMLLIQGAERRTPISRMLSEAIVRAWSEERGAGSEEWGAGILRAESRNYCQIFFNIGFLLKIEILKSDFFFKSIFGENWNLLPWIQKTLQPS
jgi:hypothetical protein